MNLVLSYYSKNNIKCQQKSNENILLKEFEKNVTLFVKKTLFFERPKKIFLNAIITFFFK